MDLSEISKKSISRRQAGHNTSSLLMTNDEDLIC